MTESPKQSGRRQMAAFAVVCAAVIVARVYLGAIRGGDLRSGWRLPDTYGLTAALIVAACPLAAVAARLGRMYFNPAAATLMAAAAGGLTTAGYNGLVGAIPGGLVGLLISYRIARRIALALLASLAAVAFGVLSGGLALRLDTDLSDGPSVATVLTVIVTLAAAIVFRSLWRRRAGCIEAAEMAAPQTGRLRGRRWVRVLGNMALFCCVVAGLWLSLSVDFARRVWKLTGYMPYRAGVQTSEVAIQPLSWAWLWPGPLAFDGQSVVFPYDATDDDLRAVSGWTTVGMLVVPGDHITDAGLDYLTGLSLRHLSLQSSKITDRGLSTLNRVLALGVMELERSRITAQGLSRFAWAGRLHRLSLKGTRLKDDDLQALRTFTFLWSLSLSGTDITDDGLRHLEPLTRLGDLDVSDTKVTKRGLEILLSFPAPSPFSATLTGKILPAGGGGPLCRLHLARTRLTDDDLRVLTRFGTIFELTLDGNPITDEAMATLSQIRVLSVLSLADTQITDAAMDDFASMDSLQSLNLRGTRVTQDGVNRLRASKPSIMLTWGD
jgi:hypothetical protein